MESEKVLTKIKLYIWIQPSWKITVFRVCPTARGRTQEVNVCLQWLYMKFPGKNQLFRELSSGEPAQSNLQQQFNLRSKSPLLTIESHICRKFHSLNKTTFLTFNHLHSWLLFIKSPEVHSKACRVHIGISLLVIIETKFHMRADLPTHLRFSYVSWPAHTRRFCKMGSLKMNCGHF